MEPYDIFPLVVLVGAVLFGAVKGMAWQIASLSAIFVSYFVALNFYEVVEGHIQTDAPWNRYIAMFVLYMGTSLAIWIGFAVVRRLIEQVQLKDFDRQAGAILGAVNGAVVCIVITFFAVTLPVLGDEQKSAICRSKSGYLIADAIGTMKVGLPEGVHRVVTPYLDGLKDTLEEHHEAETATAESDGPRGGWLDGLRGTTTRGQESSERPRLWQPPQDDRAAGGLIESIDEHFRNRQQ